MRKIESWLAWCHKVRIWGQVSEFCPELFLLCHTQDFHQLPQLEVKIMNIFVPVFPVWSIVRMLIQILFLQADNWSCWNFSLVCITHIKHQQQQSTFLWFYMFFYNCNQRLYVSEVFSAGDPSEGIVNENIHIWLFLRWGQNVNRITLNMSPRIMRPRRVMIVRARGWRRLWKGDMCLIRGGIFILL